MSRAAEGRPRGSGEEPGPRSSSTGRRSWSWRGRLRPSASRPGRRRPSGRASRPTDGGAKPVGPGNLLNDSSSYAATFHVYLNRRELPLVSAPPEAETEPGPDTRDQFTFVNEKEPHDIIPFPTCSDLSWSILRKVMAEHAAGIGMFGAGRNLCGT